MPDLAAHRSKVDALLHKYEHVKDKVKEERYLLTQAKLHLKATEHAQSIIQHVAQEVQNLAHVKIASLVSRCLEVVFGKEEAYAFKIDFQRKRGKTEAKLLFVRDGEEIDPTGAAGGGVVDVASFALRLACLVLARPHKRRLLVLDEPFRFVSAEYQERIAELLLTLTKELDIQVILVTHNESLQVGKVIRL